MDCDEVRVQISALLDDNQEVRVKGIHDHLESCSSCTEFYEEKLRVTEWLKEAENFQLEPPTRHLGENGLRNHPENKNIW